ncbi:MAG: hypothetical protein HY428_02980 [Candidatus Levybacteria bacterium]|nr:hypothetical protein [Candidatus Levybacteria bacterium]
MSLGKNKKFLLLGFVVILLVAIPVTIYMVQQQQQTTTRAQKSTTLSFEPPSSVSAPIQAAVGDQVDLDIMVDPGTNQVSIVRLEVKYDPLILEAVANTPTLNTAIFPTFLEGPIPDPTGKIAATLSIDNPSKAILAKTRIATISFKAKATTTAPTEVSYTARTQAYSVSGQDQHSEDVLLKGLPAFIAITGGEDTGPEPPPSDTDKPPGGGGGNPTPTEPPGIGTANQNPSCQSLTADTKSGQAPLDVTFTVTGSDLDGTIEKITYNYGDGQVENITEGLGEATISSESAHTYTAAGTYVASAVLTDDLDATSSTGACSLTIIVQGGIGAGDQPGSTTTTPTATPVISMKPTGPGDIFLGLGAVVGIMTVLGGLLFFML